jgi:hypothetical protein
MVKSLGKNEVKYYFVEFSQAKKYFRGIEDA